MMNKLIATALLATLLCSFAVAQQNVGFRQANIVSPLVNEDGTVTFKLRAPLARTVTVRGDWEANGGMGQMTKDSAKPTFCTKACKPTGSGWISWNFPTRT